MSDETIAGWIKLAIRKTMRHGQGKNHSTAPERLARLAEARANRASQKARVARFKIYKREMAAYWRGERATAPEKPI